MKPISLGPFDIYETVGSGGMGVVRRGVYRGAGGETPIAIKFVKPPPGDPARFREAFVREVQSSARLHHPNIVSVYDIGDVDDAMAARLDLEGGTAYLVMEYVEGGTLETQVGHLEWSDLRVVLLHLLDALAHAHALGIVHRDLKPANVLCRVTPDGLWPMLTDFGIARAMDVEPAEPAEDEPQRVAGTPYYMAPEHVMGRWRDEGPWTDVYALGALAWHLCTGRVPFAGDTGDVLRAHLMADLPVFASSIDLPAGFEAWVRRLLDKDLTRRYRRAADAAWALMQLDENLDSARTTRRVRTLVISDPGPTLSGLTASLRTPEEPRTGSAPNLAGPQAIRKHGLAPPLPRDWRRGNEGDPRMLRGAGLGLFGLRPVPIVGRDEERAALWDVLRQVHVTRRPHGMVVTGESGSGKSRLVNWLAERADEVGGAIPFRATHNKPMSNADGLVAMMTKFTRCQGLGFEAVLMRVRSLYADLELRGDDALFDAVALTERILGLNPENAGGPRFQSRDEWFAALSRLFGALSRERPVLLWLDDVHFSKESLDFAQYVLDTAESGTYPIYVLLTVPDVIEDEAALARLRAVAALPNVDQVDLEPLEETEMRELVGRMLGLSDELTDVVTERAAGSPLFAVQLVEDWVSRGILALDDGGFVAPSEVAIEVPDDIHAMWQGRVNEVLRRSNDEPAARLALRVAATLGRDVEDAEWKRACSAFGVEMPRGLVADLVGSGLAHRFDGGWSFVHALLRDSVMREIGVESPNYHQACATALEAGRSGRRKPRATRRLAEHLVAAGRPRRAFDVLLDAVIECRDMEEHRALLALVLRAEEIVERFDIDVDPVRRGALLGQHASMLRHLGELEGALQHIGSGIAVLAGDRDPASFIRVPDDGRNPLLSNLLVEHAILVFEADGDLERADSLLETAQRLATAVADPVAIGWSSKIRSRILCTMGRFEQGVEAARTAVEAYGRLKRRRPDYYFSGLHELAGALRVSGRLEEALGVLERAERWTDQVGSREALALAAMERGEVARALERYDEAREHYLTSAQLFEMLGGKNARLCTLNLCLVDVEAGELESPREELRRLCEEFPALGMEALSSHAQLALAACAAHAGDWDDYDAAFDPAAAKLRTAHVCDPELAGLAVICARECDAKSDQVRRDVAAALARDLGGVEHHETRSGELRRLAPE